jgi:hypothetical protein
MEKIQLVLTNFIRTLVYPTTSVTGLSLSQVKFVRTDVYEIKMIY